MPEKSFVFDTNTLISGICWPDSIPAQALERAFKYRVLISEEVLTEFEETISRPKFDKFKPLEERRADLKKMIIHCETIEVSIKVKACRDPKDDKFLALAKTGNAILIVSGDKDLLDLQT